CASHGGDITMIMAGLGYFDFW
nr:immunoglobulin heavy chain junction region [Macaca mulatta]MOW77898.1 immunoglobulin heavy chain junction region [Macaca mulatta]MOW85349.1 immunoglobulin heavy chain junction region [Macaca mulatta]